MQGLGKNIKRIAPAMSLLAISIALAGCVTQPPKGNINTDAIAQTLTNSALHNEENIGQSNQLPSNVTNALLPKIQLNMHNSKKALQRYDMVVNNAPAATFFQSLAKDTNDNLVVSPNITGNISLNLHHMTLPEILMAVHKIYGYRFEKTSYGYNVYPKQLMTKIFHISYLNMQRNGVSETSISAGSISNSTSSTASTGSTSETSSTASTNPASTVTTKTQNHFWQELQNGVAMIIGEQSSATTPIAPPATTEGESPAPAAPTPANNQASVLINPQAGIVVVKAYPDQLDRVAKYLRDVENIMHREVMINAKVLEVQLNAGFQSGIDWNILGASQNTTGDISSNLPNIASNIFTLNTKFNNDINATVKMLNTQGRVNTLSSPRITTVNNQKALIKVGSDNFFITGVTSNTTTNAATTTSENVDLTPFFSGIALDVTPEIDNNGDITLHIHPIISEVTSKKTFFNTGREQELPLASSTIRESDNIVRVKNNQIIMIGGMMENKNTTQEGGTPFLSKIPIAGDLFKRQDKVGAKTEIVILLQPKLITNEVTNQLLKDSAERYSKMNDDFSFNTTIQDPRASELEGK